jgi:hypothetical protein
MVLGPMHSLPFPWPINYNHVSWCNKSSTYSLLIWFWLKISYPFYEIMASRMATSYRPQVAQVNEEPPLESSLDLTLMHILSMKIPNLERCTLVLKLNPLEPGTIVFLRTLAPWSTCCKSTSLLMMNPKPFMKVIMKLKILISSHGLQFSTLDTIVGCTVRFINYLLIARQTT